MSSIFKIPPSLEGHVIQFSPGAQALTTAPSPPFSVQDRSSAYLCPESG